MLPLGDEGTPPQRGFPIINIALITINIIAFIVQLSFGDVVSTMAYGTIPYEITHGVDLVGNEGSLPQQAITFPPYITLLTSMFMHGGLAHIGGNMLFLFIFGDNVEDAMGSIRYLVFYLLCGFAATFAQIATDFNSYIPGVGASGAIAGVMAAYLVLFPGAQIRALLGYFLTRVPAIMMIGFWFVLQLFSGIGTLGQKTEGGGVAYAAHVGGFIAGLLLVWIFRRSGTSATMPSFGR